MSDPRKHSIPAHVDLFFYQWGPVPPSKSPPEPTWLDTPQHANIHPTFIWKDRTGGAPFMALRFWVEDRSRFEIAGVDAESHDELLRDAFRWCDKERACLSAIKTAWEGGK